MLTLFGNLASGNVHKVQLLLRRLSLSYLRVEVSQVRGEPRRPEYLAVNPIGKVPAVQLEDGDILSESGAILYHFAQGTSLWPGDRRWSIPGHAPDTAAPPRAPASGSSSPPHR